MRGRIRSIKPEVHTDEELWDLEERTGFPIFRLFTGLWNYADREGRFEWRPRAVKAVILPYWSGDAEAALNALASAGFVVRYEVDGKTYGLVRKFCEHQTPNHKEPESKIPPPPATRNEPTQDFPGLPGKEKDASREGPKPVMGSPTTSGNGSWEGNGSFARVPARGVVGSAHVQEFDLVASARCHARKLATPRMSRDQTRAVVERVAEMAALHGVSFPDAAGRLVDAVLGEDGTGKRFPLLCMQLDPYAQPSADETPTLKPVEHDW